MSTPPLTYLVFRQCAGRTGNRFKLVEQVDTEQAAIDRAAALRDETGIEHRYMRWLASAEPGRYAWRSTLI